MIKFRDSSFKQNNIKGIVYSNKDGLRSDINPFDHSNYTDVMKTQALKDAIKIGGYDFIYGVPVGMRKLVDQKKNSFTPKY